ncbi:hypothetical protein [Parapedobacter sp. DT-150]|uniref:hypothetical protein n=1 Tax=Parapedobacter sp. DT-150 TaxID=3396162 RepID=UPI003F1B838E
MYRGLYYFFAVWHLGCMLVYNTSSTLQGYHLLTEGAGPGYLPGARHALAALTSWPAARSFACYAGTAAGYGFFAPQVGSSFQLEVAAMDACGAAHSTAQVPILKQAHSHLRYHSLLNRLQHLLGDSTGHRDTATLRYRQAQAITHCLAQHIARQRWGGTRRIRCEVLVYHHPVLGSHGAMQQGYRIPIYQKTINQPPNR